MQTQKQIPTNAFTGNPLIDWPEKYAIFFNPGALSFAKQYDCGLSFLITGLAYEYGQSALPSTTEKNPQGEESYQNAFEQYMEGAMSGDCLCCLKISEIFSWKNNPFKLKDDKKTGWVYMTLAMFYSLCTPFGYEIDIRQKFAEYIFAMQDNFSLKETLALLKSSSDPVLKRHKEVIIETLANFFDSELTYEQKTAKFRNSLFTLSEHIDEQIIGSFLMNIFTGNQEKDSTLYETDLVHGYFNTQIIQLFALHNSTFTVAGEVHAMMLTGFTANIWHFLIWKGRAYEGEIDDCLKEMIRMVKFVMKHPENLGVPPSALQLFMAVLAWCYRKGIFVKKDVSNSHSILNNFDNNSTVANLLFDKAKVKEKLGLHNEAKSIFQRIYQTYQIAKQQLGEDKFMPFDFYCLGYIEEKAFDSKKKAKQSYAKGLAMKNLSNYKAFENLAFQRKCLKRLDKLEAEE